MQSKVIRVIAIVVIVASIFGAGFVSGLTGRSVFAQSGQPPDTVALFGPFWEAWDIVHKSYPDPVNDQVLMEGAIRGMVASIGDEFSEYLSKDELAGLNAQLSGQFAGIGISVRKDISTGGMLVVEVFANSPAKTAGLRPGDIIVSVEGKDITGLTENQIVSKIRGPAGTTVTIGVYRPALQRVTSITVKRAIIQIQNTSYVTYSGNIGYIKFAAFTEKGDQEIKRALTNLHANSLKGLIFDLRGNGGGLLDTAISVAGEFLNGGTVLIARAKAGTSDYNYTAKGKPLAPDVPMVILTDGGSASASEIFTAALHDRGRAITVGTKTFGKGEAQVLIPISTGGAVNVTDFRFFGPTGRIIHTIGIAPDYPVNWDQLANPNFDPQLNEALYLLRGDL